MNLKYRNNRFFSMILAFLLPAILILIFIFLKKTDKTIKSEGIPFLQISDKLVDSVIAMLSIEQKVDLILLSNDIFKPAQDDLISESTSKNSKVIDVKGVLSLNDISPKKALSIVFNRNQIFEIDGNEYIHSINDTTFLKSYWQNQALINDKNNVFLYYSFNKQFKASFSDSNFVKIQMEKLELAMNVFRVNNKVFGLKIDANSYLLIDSLYSKTKNNNEHLFSILYNETDLLIIDSLSVSKPIKAKIKGLCIANLVLNSIPEVAVMKNLLNGEIDNYVIDKWLYIQFRKEVINLYKDRKVDINKLNEKVKKTLKAKIWNAYNKFSGNRVILNQNVWQQRLIEKSICLLNNTDSVIPVKHIDNKKFIILYIGKVMNKEFIQSCNKYVPVKSLNIGMGDLKKISKPGRFPKNSFLIVVIDSCIKNSSDKEKFKELFKSFRKSSAVVINFANYPNLDFIPDSLNCIQIQSNTHNDYKFAAQAIFGGFSIQGRLPYHVNTVYSCNKFYTSTKSRLKYGLPGDVGIDEEKLKIIDWIAREGIEKGAYPGCQIFIAKNGEVIYNKSFGYHSYSKEIPVKNDDLYDLASVTKIAATTIAAMKMISDKKMALDDLLGKFFKNSNIDYHRIKADTVINIDTFLVAGVKNWKVFLKQNDTININDSCFVIIDTVISKLTPKLNIFKVPLVDLLKHKSGIIPATPIFRYIYFREFYIKQLMPKYLDFYGKSNPLSVYGAVELPPSFPENTTLSDSLKLLINKGFKRQYNEYFSTHYIKDSCDKVRLTENLYLKNRYFDTIWRDTKQLPVYSKKLTQYSDVNMILLQLAIDSLNNLSIDEYLKRNFYHSLGIQNISYLPLRSYNINRIVPTESDNSWRFGKLHGYVHDPSSALLGGIAGNAGLYSNAHDLGILFQMVLNQGEYGGLQYIKPSVIKTFTQRNDDTQRGLGFDMPNLKSAIGKQAPQNSYGHTGYTGTCVWVDPENQLVYVFLSNRNNPSSKNWKINSLKIRERVHDAIYQAFIPK